jgi:hypothetical protein
VKKGTRLRLAREWIVGDERRCTIQARRTTSCPHGLHDRSYKKVPPLTPTVHVPREARI